MKRINIIIKASVLILLAMALYWAAPKTPDAKDVLDLELTEESIAVHPTPTTLMKYELIHEEPLPLPSLSVKELRIPGDVSWCKDEGLHVDMDTTTRLGDPYGVPGKLLYAISLKETRKSRYKVSNKGASGTFQIMPATSEEFGVVDNMDYCSAGDGSARYLAYLHLVLFDTPIYNGDASTYRYVLAAYNAGLGRVKTPKGLFIPNFKETTDYVNTIIDYYEGELHYVARGERLSTILEDYGISLEDFKLANRFAIIDSTDLRYGEFVRIVLDNSTYVVQPGDTLYHLARKANTTVGKLRIDNRLTSNVLSVGQVLTINQL